MLWNLLFAPILLAASAVAVSSIGDPFSISGTHQSVLNGFPVQDAFVPGAWAGHTAGIVLSSASNSYKDISARFSIPELKNATGAAKEAVAAWIGIGGFDAGCENSVLRVGLDLVKGNSTTAQETTGWYQWYPQHTEVQKFTGNITFAARQEVEVHVAVTSAVRGTVTIIDQSTGKTVTQEVQGPPLCMHNAEWIVEDFAARKPPLPLANFGDVAFDTTRATTACNDAVVGPTSADAQRVNITLGGKEITEVGVGGTSVTVRYR